MMLTQIRSQKKSWQTLARLLPQIFLRVVMRVVMTRVLLTYQSIIGKNSVSHNFFARIGTIEINLFLFVTVEVRSATAYDDLHRKDMY